MQGERRLGFVKPVLMESPNGGGGASQKKKQTELEKAWRWLKSTGQVGTEAGITFIQNVQKRTGGSRLPKSGENVVTTYQNTQSSSGSSGGSGGSSEGDGGSGT